MSESLEDIPDIIEEDIVEGQKEVKNTNPKEAEAREQGWVSKEEFRGDPSKHVDMETFLKRGETHIPLIKKELQNLKESNQINHEVIRNLKKQLDEEKKQNLNKSIKVAFEEGDITTYEKLQEQRDNVIKEQVQEESKYKTTKEENNFSPEIANWVQNNYKYNNDADYKNRADLEYDYIARLNPHYSAGQVLQELDQKLDSIYKPKPSVNTVGGRQSTQNVKQNKTINDLTQSQKITFTGLVRKGIFQATEVQEYINLLDK